jgi:hypothetical protein
VAPLKFTKALFVKKISKKPYAISITKIETIFGKKVLYANNRGETNSEDSAPERLKTYIKIKNKKIESVLTELFLTFNRPKNRNRKAINEDTNV